MKAVGRSVTPYQFMLYTNLSMSGVAFFMCIILGELTKGLEFISTEKEVKIAILRFAACSAMGQSFIFYAIANFDPLMCTTITTTRKIFSVLLSLLFKGHNISGFGWLGILLASGGVMSEVEMKRKKGEEGKRKKFGVEMKGEKFREEESQSLVMGGNTTGTMSRRSSTDLLSDSKSDSSLI
ncbi:hypothetical protein TrLO_g9258 [Triparma laevis f. longispina]|uniref:Uncharacterized protein n=1 Tax=Triparma laevis f. longispina TaxID=1714387 RepID=A0A9W7FQG3_9STRA|nr:hypothetical protein TrLO_g9258 [Triparma laevis f. longispina]